MPPQKPREEPPATPAPSGILDNRENGKVGEFLREKITPGAEVRVVSAYFSIYAHQALRAELESAGTFRFLFGDPRSAGSVASGEDGLKRFLIHEDGAMGPAMALTQKHAAAQCEKWIADGNVSIRTMRDEFLHGKMFHISDAERAAALCGSSNFTARGLGVERGNRELNIIADDETADDLRRWFDALWSSRGLLRNAKDDVLAALKRLGKNQDPQFVYFLTLYRLFRDELEKAAREADNLKMEDSEIWNQLYGFQRDAVYGVINRLTRWGGCILADSVGLGKTYTALAVVKHFQNERVLVLCPKRLEQNWRRFLFNAPGKNPLEADRFNYHVRAHTDLTRENPEIWSKYDLVVIDESHNFRNHAGARFQTLRSALRRGGKAKVLMLSATPVNTSLKDIRNQILLAAEDDDFRRELGVASVAETVRRAQDGFNQWEQAGGRDKTALMERLDGAFLKLTEAVTIARNRKHVRTHYADAFAPDGGGGKLDDFPKRRKPEDLAPETDAEGELSYRDVSAQIRKFGLSVYRPACYLRPDSPARAAQEAEAPRFKQTDREYYLIGMMQVNFLKRLESSAHSFCRTLERTIEKIQAVERKIARFQGGETGLLIGEEDAPDPEEHAEDDEFMVGKGLQYDLRHMQLDNWSRDLKNDRKTLREVLNLANKVTPARDGKLAALKNLLRDKAQNPPRDKDDKPNRKALVFTSFTDTAAHLYDNLRHFARSELGLHIGLVVGSGANRTTAQTGRRELFQKADHPAEYADILNHFAPRARGLNPDDIRGAEIDILIATDCVSEGQNLQDCDMVVNYDIHWNPVRIIQRFGRVDRIGGRNREVRRADFWPNIALNEYLNLQERVRARMALALAVAAGDAGDDDPEAQAKAEIDFRDEQLRRLREEALTADDLSGVSISDFTMADFLAELRAFLEKNREQLETAPDGLFAVVESDSAVGAEPGVVFCLRKRGAQTENNPDPRRAQNPAHPYFLAYVRRGENGPEVRFGFQQTKPILKMFGDLCRDKTEPSENLCRAFDAETENGENMTAVARDLKAAVDDIIRRALRNAARSVGPDGDGELPEEGEMPQNIGEFELVSWLVVRKHPV